MKTILKILISLVFTAIAVAHVFLPSITIDTITIILIVLVAIPWLLPYIKDFEIHGVGKISLADTKAATSKLDTKLVMKAGLGQYKLTGHPAQITYIQNKESPIDLLRRLSETNPNLALIGFRNEIEKRIIQLAEIFSIPTENVSLSRLVDGLVNRDVISKSSALGLTELIALGNQAAHKADVTREAIEWVLDIGPSILMRLEDVEIPVNDDEDPKGVS